MRDWVGGSTTTWRRWRDCASSSSLLRARRPRSRSAWDCTRPRQARRRAPSFVSDILAAHDGLRKLGIDVSDIWHGPPFPVEARQPGPDPARTSYGSFFSVSDPDGNTWLVQEVTTRHPGRMNAAETGYASTADLAGAAWRGRGRSPGR